MRAKPHFNIIITYWGPLEQDILASMAWLDSRAQLNEFIIGKVGKVKAKKILKVSCAIYYMGDKGWLSKDRPTWHEEAWQTFYDFGAFPTITDKSDEEWEKYWISTSMRLDRLA